MKTLRELTETFAQDGRLEWIGVRHARRKEARSVSTAEIDEAGILGDHYSGKGKRAVTLIQSEHIPVIQSLLGGPLVEPAMLRRNLVVSGINLLGLRASKFRIGSVVLEGTGICAPCSRMEECLGRGGYTALRGHGGITARVIQSGVVSVGDVVSSA